jgi:hypothetical protein
MVLIKRILSDVRRGKDIDAYVMVVAALVLSVLSVLDVLPACGCRKLGHPMRPGRIRG